MRTNCVRGDWRLFMEEISHERLIAALRAQGIRYLADGADISGDLSARDLIAGLASHSDPRLRSALTPLFFAHPEFATEVPRILPIVDSSAAIELQARYMAAVYLQHFWRTRLSYYLGDYAALPDLFSRDMALPLPDEHFGKLGLAALAEWHAEHSTGKFNRLASYQKTVEQFIGQLRAEAHPHEHTSVS